MGSAKGRLVGGATILTLLAGLLLPASAVPAHASCAAEPEETIAGQETVFLATVIEQTARYARVEVEEVWRGPDLAPSVWLQTSPAELPPWPVRLIHRVATSVDAELVPGTRYVIATVDGGYETNSCLVTEASAPLVERLAPEDARQPAASGATGNGPGILEGASGFTLLIALIAALPVGGWLVYRRARAVR